MSLKLRLILIVNFLLFVAIFFGFFSVVFTSKNAVRSEIESSLKLAEFSIKTGIQKNPDLYLFQDNLLGLKDLDLIRHLSIQLLDSDGNIIDQNKKSNTEVHIPVWFQNALDIYSKDLEILDFPLMQYGDQIGAVKVIPNPIYEYEEIWQQFKNGLIIVMLFFVFVNLSIFFLFGKIISPINLLIQGFRNLEQGKYKNNKENFGISELDILRVKLNQLTIKLKKNDKRIHELNQKLISIQEQEKKEISRDLHDEIGQSLAAIQVQAAAIKTSRKANAQADLIISTTKDLMQQTRNLIKRLSLSIIDDLGIEDALIDLIKNWSRRTLCKNINVNVDLPDSKIFKSQLNETVYRLTQEALTNMSKHSRPKEVLISVQRNGNVIHLCFMNNGIFKRTKKTGGIGILGMQERVKNLSGSFKQSIYKGFYKIEIGLPIK
ncbi:histidine kinase [Methylophilaceae bacterium]|nr:histidine kinase [Methylophilaceae bacterium]